MNITAATFFQEPIEFVGICKVYPPTVKEVVLNKNFPRFSQLLTISQEDLDDLFRKEKKDLSLIPNFGEKIEEEKITPFDFLMNNFLQEGPIKKIILEGFQFFTHDNISILPELEGIWFIDHLKKINKVEDFRILKKEDYPTFQNAIRAVLGQKLIDPIKDDEDPRIAHIKAKARERDRIKEKQEAKKEGAISLETFLSALCCMGIGITPLNIGEISYASARLLSRTYQEREKYGVDMQFIAGGADPKKMKIEYWIRNLKD